MRLCSDAEKALEEQAETMTEFAKVAGGVDEAATAVNNAATSYDGYSDPRLSTYLNIVGNIQMLLYANS